MLEAQVFNTLTPKEKPLVTDYGQSFNYDILALLKAVGEGKLLDNGTRHSLCVKVGDKVLFGKYSGQVVKIDGKELLVMREEDLMGVIEA